MSDESENDTQWELAAWEMLRDCRKQLAEVTKQRDRLADALQMWRAEGPNSNACFCDAQFAMHGAHPSHSDECKAAIDALSYLKTSQMEVASE